MDVRELNEEQLDELKWTYFYDMESWEYEYPWDIPDDVIFNHYAGIDFVDDDFSCTAKNSWTIVDITEIYYDSKNIQHTINRKEIIYDNDYEGLTYNNHYDNIKEVNLVGANSIMVRDDKIISISGYTPDRGLYQDFY